MMAQVGDGSFSHREWLFEPKLDGFRALAHVRHGKLTLRSRTGLDMTEKLPEVVAELAAQPVDEMVVDGELVVLDEEGMPSFEMLQAEAWTCREAGGPEGRRSRCTIRLT